MRVFCFGLNNSTSTGKGKLKLLKLAVKDRIVFTAPTVAQAVRGLLFTKKFTTKDLSKVQEHIYVLKNDNISNAIEKYDSVFIVDDVVAYSLYGKIIRRTIDEEYNNSISVYTLADMCNFNVPRLLNGASDIVNTSNKGWFAFTEGDYFTCDSKSLPTMAFSKKSDVLSEASSSACDARKNITAVKFDDGFYMYHPKNCDGNFESELNIVKYDKMVKDYKALVCNYIDKFEKIFIEIEGKSIIELLAFLNFDIKPFKEYKNNIINGGAECLLED